MEVKFDNDILLVSPLSPQNNYGQFFLEGIEKPLLLDNGLNYKMLPLECSYTVGSVTNEGDTNKYWTALSRSAHIYETTYTRSDFSLNGGAVQVTGTGQYEGVSAEVFYSTMAGAVNTGTVCPKNDTAMVTLTGSQGAIVVCSHVLKSKTKHISILATKGAIESSEIDDFIKSKKLPTNVTVHKINASDLVALVEPGIFQSDPQKTEEVIRSVIDPVLSKDQRIDVMTLSSTHLPFLRDFLVKVYPDISFLDPASAVVFKTKEELKAMNLLSTSIGSLKVITTIDAAGKLNLNDLNTILSTLGLKAEIEEVKI